MLRYCDQQFNATFNCFNCSLEEEWCRNKNSRYLCASCLNSFTHGVVHRRTFKLLSSFAWSYSCRNVCSIGLHEPCVRRSVAASHALYYYWLFAKILVFLSPNKYVKNVEGFFHSCCHLDPLLLFTADTAKSIASSTVYRALPYCLGAFPLPSPNPLRRSSQTPARS